MSGEMNARYFKQKTQWWYLPRKLRKRWNRETDFGQRQPSDALLWVIETALRERRFQECYEASLETTRRRRAREKEAANAERVA